LIFKPKTINFETQNPETQRGRCCD